MSKNYNHTKIACYLGYIVQAIINNFLPILFIIFQSDYNLNYEQLGRIIFINFSTQLVVDFLTPYIVKFTGYRGAVLLCNIFAAAGLCMLGILPLYFENTYMCIALSVVVYAIGSGIIEVVLSPLIELLPSKNNEADMSIMHSFYCWGQALTVLITTVLVLKLGFSNWHFIPIIWSIVPIINFFSFISVPIIEPPKHQNTRETTKIFKNSKFWCFAVFMLCAGASEIAMSDWASLFAQNALGVDKFVGDLLGPCTFAIFMGTGRIIFGFFAGKFSIRKMLIINNLLCCGCYMAVALFNAPLFSLLACAFCGFTVSLSWPGTYSMAAQSFPQGSTQMFSILALCGDLGCSTGPWLLGFVADRISLESGFLVCTVFPAILIFTAIFLMKEKD